MAAMLDSLRGLFDGQIVRELCRAPAAPAWAAREPGLGRVEWLRELMRIQDFAGQKRAELLMHQILVATGVRLALCSAVTDSG